MAKPLFENRELSWLDFNGRVLQEAQDDNVPLLEKIKFLAIFSSNLDEFYRVRVATLNRLVNLNNEAKALLGYSPKKILRRIKENVVKQELLFNHLYQDIFNNQLAQENIFILNEKQLEENGLGDFVRNHFKARILSRLNPVIIDLRKPFPELKDQSTYLFIKMKKKGAYSSSRYALIDLPSKVSRFLVLPPTGEKRYVVLLDDVIRYCLDEIFFNFDFNEFDAYSIQLTRDAELDLDTDVSERFIEKLTKGLQRRQKGKPMRLLYDINIKADMLSTLVDKMGVHSDSLIPGARYLNFKDFIKFPNFDRADLENLPSPPLAIPTLAERSSLIEKISEKDYLVSTPYQTFDYLVHFLREAAIDPKVKVIQLTVYRLAENSKIISALINAVRNGKKVNCYVELTARFDEQANIEWTRRLQEENVNVLYAFGNYKVHSKVCLVTRRERSKNVHYALLSTGNFNEDSAKIYADHTLLTSDKRLSNELARFFEMLNKKQLPQGFKHLVVSPIEVRDRWEILINNEIQLAKAGKKAYIILKMNSLTDTKIISKLYQASNAGVKIKLIVRGMCCLIPNVRGVSENIQLISIVDKFLEHARVYIFSNAGDEKIFLSSADWMTRNLDKRVEVGFPIYDEGLKKEIRDIINLQLMDNTKARLPHVNKYIKPKSGEALHRAQVDIYNYFKQQKEK